ncbi:chloride channel protein [Aureimonas sp. AU12]|uniref:chloride channel protein n=1 Tax=Aureimonas sp. AU12 TaxID=1638161 RepID=UPI000781D10E|nr:chloride channel protein [Aureimonas sp. AU12]
MSIAIDESPALPGPKETLRRFFRRSETWFVLLASVVGAAAGALTVAIGTLAHLFQAVLFSLPADARLSAMPSLTPLQLAVLPLGGAILAAFGLIVRARRRALVDAVEANALHGGRMSVRDSLVISGQTVLSNGFGASVGLEAAYAQMGGAAASIGGRAFALRRADFRTLVGAGAGAGIAAAFGAPLVGAFYAFEIVIGAYTPAAIAPVAAAALSGSLVAKALGAEPYVLAVHMGSALGTADYLVYALLGALAALVGIALMRAVALVEAKTRPAWLPRWMRPAIGGALLIPIAIVSPQALSAGHGALHLDIGAGAGLSLLATVFLAKCLASIVSLGFGFRGGLFFASLFLGTLLGHLFAGILALVAGTPIVDGGDAAVVGMAALAVAVIGGPMTMAMLVLETTQDFTLTGAVLAASLVASTIVRESFGYSFSTWRLHLRGETIKSARDVGWVKTLTAGRMMRRDARSAPAGTTIAEFRRRFPLGSTSRVVLTGEDGRYLGIVVTAAAYAENVELDTSVEALAGTKTRVLAPENDIGVVMATFDDAGTDELAIVDRDGQVLGFLSETYVRKRYAEELEKAQRDFYGER